MGSSSPLLLWLISCTIAMVIMADQYGFAGASMELRVGGDREGWRQPPQDEPNFYNQWASRNRFHVGDSIRFEYKNDSVLVVDKYDYYHCSSATPTAAYGDGNTTIRFDKPGPVYFISGNLTHCLNGQKIDVDVMGIRSEVLYPPPSSANPPESFRSVAPAPSTSDSPANYLFLPSLMVAIIVGLISDPI